MYSQLTIPRYATADGGMDWEDAEKQVRKNKDKSKKSLTVSVRNDTNGSKRKAGEAVNDALTELTSLKQKKKKKSSKKT
jgi:hypothetical protein